MLQLNFVLHHFDIWLSEPDSKRVSTPDTTKECVWLQADMVSHFIIYYAKKIYIISDILYNM